LDGKVEDSGDFSDFYIPPAEHMTEEQKRQFQQIQDEVHHCATMYTTDTKSYEID